MGNHPDTHFGPVFRFVFFVNDYTCAPGAEESLLFLILIWGGLDLFFV